MPNLRYPNSVVKNLNRNGICIKLHECVIKYVDVLSPESLVYCKEVYCFFATKQRFAQSLGHTVLRIALANVEIIPLFKANLYTSN